MDIAREVLDLLPRALASWILEFNSELKSRCCVNNMRIYIWMEYEVTTRATGRDWYTFLLYVCTSEWNTKTAWFTRHQFQLNLVGWAGTKIHLMKNFGRYHPSFPSPVTGSNIIIRDISDLAPLLCFIVTLEKLCTASDFSKLWWRTMFPCELPMCFETSTKASRAC